MMLHCPVCGELGDFHLQTRYEYDSVTGPNEQEYAVCPNCLTAIDAADLDRQAELEKKDDEEGKKNGTTGNN